MTLAEISSGHRTAADVMLLIAAILFFVEFVLIYITKLPQTLVLRLAGFGLIALALLVA